MTKPTILILIIVYLASVLIVGIFGMQIMSFNNINYIDSITLTEDNDHFELSHKDYLLKFKENQKGLDAIPYYEYILLLDLKVGMTVKLTPIIKAVDSTLDPTNKELDVNISYSKEIDKGCITYANGIFTINKAGDATITYKSKDNSNKKMVVKFLIG